MSNRENCFRLESSGYRRIGRPKRKCRRAIEDEIRNTRRSWNEVKGIAVDRNAWKLDGDYGGFVGLHCIDNCSTTHIYNNIY